MKKTIVVFFCVFVLALSCDLPKSITIKGSPEVYIPVGSPFKALGDDGGIEKYINPAEIKNMMGLDARIYEYRGDDESRENVQTYLVHYPIMEMKLDLSKNISDAIENNKADFTFEIPDYVSGYTQAQFDAAYYNGCFVNRNGQLAEYEDGALFIIDLSDMKKVVDKIVEGPFGLEITNYDKSLKDNLQIKIPALGINDYIYGKETTDGKTLQFLKDKPAVFEPRTHLNDDGGLEIFVKFTGPCSGTLAPDIVLEWKTATINTANDDFNGFYNIENSVGEFLGNGVAFKSVQGYIYVHGVGDDATLSLKAGDIEMITGNSTLIERSKPAFSDPLSNPLPPHSLQQSFIEMTSLVNTSGASTLFYNININEVDIDKDDVGEHNIISADLVILLALDFEVTNESLYDSDYVTLNFGLEELFSDMGDGDWFMREDGENEDGDDGNEALLSNLEWVRITFKNFRNSIFDSRDLAVLLINISPDGSEFKRVIDFSKSNPSLEIKIEDLPDRFSPKLEILLKKEAGMNYGSLVIKPLNTTALEFDFFLTLEAKAKINQTIKL